MVKILFFSLFNFFLVNLGFGQNYSPLEKGNKWTFKMPNATYTTEVLKETYNHDGKEYYQKQTEYSWGKTDVYHIRIDENGDELYLDPKSLTETVNMPAKIELGHSWVSTDGAWKYEIYELGQKLKTPEKTYGNCLVIKAQQLTGRDKKLSVYYNHYVDGIGYVGSKNERGLMSYLTKYKLK